MAHELRPVASEADWRQLHRIRRQTLFVADRHDVPYDENHPDDRRDGNVPYLLLHDGQAVGVVRLDFRGRDAVVRLVGIAAGLQGQGHGRALGDLVEAEARRHGVSALRVNAAPDAVGYYQAMGWHIASWDPGELVGISRDSVQMTKEIAP